MIALRKMQIERSTLLLLFLLLFASAYALAQLGNGKTSTPATPRLEELREKGSEAVFNLDYEAARQTFKEMVRLFPADSTGCQMFASTRGWETVNKSGL